MHASYKLEIGDYCFYESTNLREVDLSGNDLTAGRYLFDKCFLLKSAKLRGIQHQNISKYAHYGFEKKNETK